MTIFCVKFLGIFIKISVRFLPVFFFKLMGVEKPKLGYLFFQNRPLLQLVHLLLVYSIFMVTTYCSLLMVCVWERDFKLRSLLKFSRLLCHVRVLFAYNFDYAIPLLGFAIQWLSQSPDILVLLDLCVLLESILLLYEVLLVSLVFNIVMFSPDY